MNVWKVFESLLPRQQIVIGEVVTVNVNQTCEVALLSGEHVTVKGAGTVGVNYLIKDGVIINEMPDIPSYNVDIS